MSKHSTHRLHVVGRARGQRGISIVEALVALVVIAVGMLGIALAAIVLASVPAGAGRASLEDADRFLLAGEYSHAAAAYGTDTYGGEPAAQDCYAAKRCTPEELAQDDLARWIADIRELLPGADAVTGTVTVTDRNRPESDNYVIVVTWREANSDIDYSYTVSMNLANNLRSP